jgi:hypothetical protein
MESITTRTAKIWLREDGIVQAVSFPNSYQTLEDAQVNAAALARMGQEKPRPWLIDIRLGQGVDRPARVYYSSAAVARFTRAVALLIGSPVSRVVANFFIGLNKQLVPTQLFTSEEQAVTWLQTFLDRGSSLTAAAPGGS